MGYIIQAHTNETVSTKAVYIFKKLPDSYYSTAASFAFRHGSAHPTRIPLQVLGWKCSKIHGCEGTLLSRHLAQSENDGHNPQTGDSEASEQ